MKIMSPFYLYIYNNITVVEVAGTSSVEEGGISVVLEIGLEVEAGTLLVIDPL